MVPNHHQIMATWPEFKFPPINLYSIGAYLGTRSMSERMNLKERLESARKLNEASTIAENIAKSKPQDQSVDATLEERGKRYGHFGGHAGITQRIKLAMKISDNWESLSDDKKEALEMIAHKLGRILNGDPNYGDSWHDIAGYAQLVEKEILANEN